MSKPEEIQIGKTYTVPCPFVRDVYTEWSEDGSVASLTWKPGVDFEDSDYHTRVVAHGMGSVSYTVVDVHKLPAPYPARVFFTRRWSSPDGRQFGKGRLHIMTVQAFGRRLRGYKPGGVDEDTDLVVADLTEDEKALRLGSAA